MELYETLIENTENFMEHVGNFMEQVGNPFGQVGDPIGEDLSSKGKTNIWGVLCTTTA